MLLHFQGQPVEIPERYDALVTGPDEMSDAEWQAEQEAWRVWYEEIDILRAHEAAQGREMAAGVDRDDLPFD